MQPVLIILLCIASAICYGIVHDQITARICIEYFTIGHPPLFATTSPTLLGLGWGVVATWWVGLVLGVPLAIAARLGSRPTRTAASLVRPIIVLLLLMGCCATVAGVIGYVLASKEVVVLVEPMAAAIPPEKRVPFLADLWAHNASYLIGFLGGIVLVVMTWKARGAASVALRECGNPGPSPAGAGSEPDAGLLDSPPAKARLSRFSAVVRFDDESVSCRRASGLVETVEWSELRAVVIQTTADGPAVDDVFWVLIGEKSGCVVPSEAAGINDLLRRLQELPGFDNRAVIEAMSCTDDREFLCWRWTAERVL